MKFIHWPSILALMVLTASCSPRMTGAPALPETWYKLPEQGGVSAGPSAPGPEFDSRVAATFGAHTAALTQLSQTAALTQESGGNGLKNWTPWHLDGMIASFTVSVEGLFGILMGQGSATVQGTWKQTTQEKPLAAVKRKKPATLKFTSKMTAKDVPGLVEPLVRAAVGTKSVVDKDRLRRNLNRKAQQFLTLARAVSRVENRRAWKAQGFELQLAFNASGQISPAVGVGGTFTVFLEWEREEGESLRPASLAEVDDSPIYRNMNQFTDLMSSLIPEFRREAAPMGRYGFDFSEFEVGITVTVGGDIGIAALQGSIAGQLKFARDPGFVEAADLPEPPESVALKIIGPKPSVELEGFVAGHQIRTLPMTSFWDSGETAMVYEVARGRFREGMKNAVAMATYFTAKARAADTPRWQISHVQVEFAASITGDVVVATISGQGQMVLGFERVGS